MLKNFKELKVWQRSYELCLEIYRITKGFPKEERYGLTSQIRRAVVSVPSNIAEGYGRKTLPEYIQALYVAYGSICEVETQMLLSGDLGYIKVEDMKKFQRDIGEVERMLKALIRSLENKSLTPRPLESLNPVNNKGFSLVELLIAMAIAAIVGIAGFSIFSSSSWSQKTQEDITEAQQNVRIAMDRLAKDIRMAGFGLPDPPFSITIGTSGALTAPITVTNSSTGPDTITILGIGYETGTLQKGTNIDCNDSGKGKICLDSVDPSTNNFFSSDLTTFKTSRKYISLNGTTFIELADAQTERLSGKLTLSNPAALDRSYPDGTPVYIIQAVQYTINNTSPFLEGCSSSNPCLASLDYTGLRGGTGNDRQVLAENIEDIQFAYGLDGSIAPNYEKDGKIDYSGSYTDSTAFYFSSTGPTTLSDPSTIIAVRATIVGRTRNKDMRGQTGFRAQCFEDRPVDAGTTNCTGAAPDGYRRRTLTKLLKIRNPRTGA